MRGAEKDVKADEKSSKKEHFKHTNGKYKGKTVTNNVNLSKFSTVKLILFFTN